MHTHTMQRFFHPMPPTYPNIYHREDEEPVRPTYRNPSYRDTEMDQHLAGMELIEIPLECSDRTVSTSWSEYDSRPPSVVSAASTDISAYGSQLNLLENTTPVDLEHQQTDLVLSPADLAPLGDPGNPPWWKIILVGAVGVAGLVGLIWGAYHYD
ncbi:hypothetical protein EDC01DRAFT_626530 [Geopyxis carbonaria]|nr:hypothetical protein EDC01DRAFT_626530 [Geopyxis carbonaria]